jgi:hypothetical protein
MAARRTSGLSEKDSLDAKVFMRTFNDALGCAKDIAEREAGRAHYKDYVRLLVKASRESRIVLDTNGDLVSSVNG